MIEIGKTYTVRYPFVLAEVELWPDDPEATAPVTVKCWRPGTEFEEVETPYNSRTECYAGGHGSMLLTVIDVHRPGKFPTRVFYTRQWRDPTGKVFGKGGLRIKTQQAFNRMLAGYRHEYEVVPPEMPVGA